ncbi:TlpA family protein disulfide reductase [Streptomyces erythrochromogenes]|uniref:TlpA family protein disulfide reductase n=1 Tax=Streptomyces erythrochromogenes TaxID=285574 RepID=UPI0034193C95
MLTSLSVLALLLASASCALSLAVALRVKKLLDPMVQEGLLSRRRPDTVPVGAVIGMRRSLSDLDGERVELPAGTDGSWLVSFQAVGCAGCKEQLPDYRRYLQDLGLPRDRVLAVIHGDMAEADLYRRELGDLATLVSADGPGPGADLVAELGVSIFPTYLVVSAEGTVVRSEVSSARLRQAGSLQASRTAPAPVGG